MRDGVTCSSFYEINFDIMFHVKHYIKINCFRLMVSWKVYGNCWASLIYRDCWKVRNICLGYQWYVKRKMKMFNIWVCIIC